MEIDGIVGKNILLCEFVCVDEARAGLGGRQVQANYPILGRFSGNYTLVVHSNCYSLAVVLILH